MANPQTENGFTKIANELLEALVRTELNGSGHALILAIMRKTYGYNKKEDKISISQLEEMLGLSRRAVIYNIQDLEAKNIIIVKREQKGELSEINVIKFNKNYDLWAIGNSAQQVEENRKRALERYHQTKTRGSAKVKGSAKVGQKVVQKSEKNEQTFAPTKETITKEITKESAETSSASIVSLIDLFKDINPTYKKWYANKTQRAASARLIERYGFPTLARVLDFLPQSNKTPYMPIITTPLQLEDGWAKLEGAWIKKKNEKINKGKQIIT